MNSKSYSPNHRLIFLFVILAVAGSVVFLAQTHAAEDKLSPQTFSISPISGETKVNSVTTGAQFAPAVAPLTGGGYVITWLDNDRNGIFAQRFDSSGNPQGGEIAVNDPTAVSLLFSSVASLTNGSFVIVWQSGIFASADIRGRRFDSGGNPLGSDFPVNTNTPNEQLDAQVIGLDNGGFVVSWDTIAGDHYQDVSAQVFDSTGAKLGSEFLINTTTSGAQGIVSLAPLTGGGFVAVWQSQDSSQHVQIFAQRFGVSGNKVGSEFQINEPATKDQDANDVAPLGNGFVVSWVRKTDSGRDLLARRFDANGSPIEGEITVASATGLDGTSVIPIAAGGFAVVWSDHSSTSSPSIFIRGYDSSAAPGGPAVPVNQPAPFSSVLTSDGAATLTNGNLVNTWDGPSTNTSEDIYMRRFAVDNTANTQPGTNVPVQSSAGDARVTFSQVSASGTTSFTPISPSSAGTPPAGYTIVGSGPAYDITTSATFTPPITVCLTVSSVNDPADFARLRILHGEGGQLIDRTILSPDSPAPDFSTRTVCARVNSLSPFVPALAPAATPSPSPSPSPSAAATIQFAQASYNVPEDVTFVTVTINRSGDISGASTIDYATADVTASERKDYTTAVGTLRFAAGETSKTIDLLISEDSFVEGLETFSISLTNPVGATLGSPAISTVQVNDDVTEPATNAIDDPANFVGQHYHDFLNRQADTSGLNFWTGIISSCGSTASCIDQKRSSDSAAFFLSIEFQQTGFQVIRAYKATFVDTAARPRGFPRYREFLRDEQEISRGVIVGQGNWQQQLSDNTLNFARAWVQRPEVLVVLPDTGAIPDQYVDKLFANSEVTPTATERSAAVTAFGAGGADGRARALLSVTASGSVYNKQYNPAFVLMQYLGYLRRNPNDAPDGDYSGFDFWLTKLNAFSSPGEDVRDSQTAERRVLRAQMVTAFIVSSEYRQRFGP